MRNNQYSSTFITFLEQVTIKLTALIELNVRKAWVGFISKQDVQDIKEIGNTVSNSDLKVVSLNASLD
jgi:hypothetical protein